MAKLGRKVTSVLAPRSKVKETRYEECCPFCAQFDITSVSDCFDVHGKKICELWFCNACSGFFPRSIDVEPARPVVSPAVKVNRAEAEPAPKKVISDDEDAGEKRKAPRFPVQFVVQVDFSEKASSEKTTRGREKGALARLSDPLVAMVLDAGIGGLCFRYPEYIEEGREGRMMISLPSVARSFSAKARVVRSSKLPDGSYGLGVQFIDVESEYRDALRRYVALD